MRAAFPWRGYVSQITYGADLSSAVDEDFVAAIAEDLVRQRTFTQPVADYYRAAADALRSGEDLAFGERQDEAAVRDFLTRLLLTLDERKPWPEPPFRQEGSDTWPALRDAPVLARIPLAVRQVEERLNRIFDTIGAGGDEADVLILRLRTGQVVALVSKHSLPRPGIDLLARTDPAATVMAFRELTGIDALR